MKARRPLRIAELLTLTFTLVVMGVSAAAPALADTPPPTANPDSYSTGPNTTLHVDGEVIPGVLANDEGGGGPKLAVLDTNVSHGDPVTLNANGTFDYTPATDFEGTDSFTYHVTVKGVSSAPTTVTITVATPPPNTAPSLTIPSLNPIWPKTKDTLQASTTTSDPDGDNVSVAWVWKVTRGANTCQVKTDSSASAAAGTRTVSLDLDQAYPTSNCTGASPLATINPSKGDTVTVEATPSDGTATGTMESSSVRVANTAPVAQDDGPYVAQGGTTLSVSAPGVLANDADPDGDKLSAVQGTSTAHGTLNLNANGSLSYTPAPGVCNRSDSFTYRANDGTLNSALATASITVQTARGSTTLTLTPSATRVLYGRSVFLTAHLSAFSPSAVVSIYKTPLGGARTLVKRGHPGSRGNLGAKVTPSKLTSYRAVSTDNCYVAGNSGPRQVQVAPRVGGHMVGFFARDGRYALYHSGGLRLPKYHASVSPDHPGKPVRFVWQRRAARSWKAYLAQTLSLNANSAINVIMTQGVIKGIRYRVRIVFLADGDHVANAAPWAYFKAV